MAKKQTLREKMEEARGLQEMSAIKSALSAYLRTKYLPTDARPSPFVIACDGSPVSVTRIQEMSDQLEAEADELLDEYKALVGEVTE